MARKTTVIIKVTRPQDEPQAQETAGSRIMVR